MFANLRKGSTVYVLDTRDVPRFYMAQVKDVSLPYYPSMQPGQFNAIPGQQFVNISIIDGDVPWGVPVNLDTVTKDGLTVSMKREGLMPAVTAAQQESQNIVNSYEKHKANLLAYEQILKDIDPSYARSVEQDEEIQKLRKIIAEQNARIKQLPTMEDLKKLFDKEQTKTSK